MSKTPETLNVQDMNCSAQYPVRVHEIIVDGETHRVEMKYSKKTQLPYALAMKFLIDKSFHVTDETGKRIRPTAKTPDGKAMQLEDNQVVAYLDELTQGALAERAAAAPGGEMFKGNSKKDEMIEFLIANRQNKPHLKQVETEPDEAESTLGGEMSDDQAAAMLAEHA